MRMKKFYLILFTVHFILILYRNRLYILNYGKLKIYFNFIFILHISPSLQLIYSELIYIKIYIKDL